MQPLLSLLLSLFVFLARKQKFFGSYPRRYLDRAQRNAGQGNKIYYLFPANYILYTSSRIRTSVRTFQRNRNRMVTVDQLASHLKRKRNGKYRFPVMMMMMKRRRTSKRQLLRSRKQSPRYLQKYPNPSNTLNLNYLFQKRRIVDESDEEIPHKKKSASDQKKPNLSMLKDTKPKEVDLASIYGKSPVQRVEREKKVKPIPKLEIPSDDEFERSIANLDEPKEPTPKKRDNKTPQKNKKTPTKTPVKKELTPKREIVKTPKLEKEKEKPDSTLNNSVSNGTEEKASKSTPTKSKPPAKPSLESKSKPKSAKKTVSTKNVKKQEESDLETSVMMDEERHEKKQLLGIMYQKFKNRSTVLNPGSKEIPEGKPNCLAGKTFLVTGILEAMERVEAEELIKKYGGKVLSGVTKKLMFMVVGEEAGPAKLAKADDLNVKQLSEDGLLDMIRESNDSGKKEPKSTPIKQKKEFKIEKNKSSEKKKKKERKSEEFTEFVVKKKLKLEPESHEVAGSSKEPEVELKNVENLAWVDKYKPTSTKQIIGQQGAASNCVK